MRDSLEDGVMISKLWPADLKSLSSIQIFIEKLSKIEGLSTKKTSQINISVEELVVNIINYGFSDNTGENIQIDVQVNQDQITFSIVDSGKYFNPLIKKDPDLTQDTMDRPIGGLGIFLVKQFADQVDYERRDNKNIFTMTINKKE